jgi:5-methyltetrahydrofolate--homocysteine methyltransferase
MTTTVRSMENTIRALKEEGLPCKVMVGGAVLNSEYAQLIGADYYGRDARAAVKIAQGFFG